MPTLPVLAPSAIEQLRRDHERLRLEVRQLRAMVRALGRMDPDPFVLVKPDSGDSITSLGGLTPGSGTGQVYRLRGGGGNLVDTDHAEDVYNPGSEIVGGQYAVCLRDEHGRLWAVSRPLVKQWVTFEATAVFTVTDPSVTGNVVDQWGQGYDRTISSPVFYNEYTDDTLTTRAFSGADGDYGIAVWQGNGDNYRIVAMLT